MILHHLIALTIAIVLDLVIGDPPDWPHPVRWIGKMISAIEQRWNTGRFRKQKGIAMVLVVLFIVGVLSGLLVWGCYSLHPAVGIIVEGALIATTIAQKSLKEAALEVYYPLDKADLVDARMKLGLIVGRDTDQLDEGEITRGTVETVAENTSDGITAPLFWAMIGGAPCALLYRAINTCDSMVGYRNDRFEQFGWASAKLDDVVNWIPSRLTSILMFISNKPEQMSRSKAWRILLRDAKKHPSPNSGWGEASVAVLLGVQLGGVNYYDGIISNRAKMGNPLIPLHKEHILKTNSIMARASFLFLLLLWLGGFVIELASPWFKPALHL